jgi:hypothetical protein
MFVIFADGGHLDGLYTQGRHLDGHQDKKSQVDEQTLGRQLAVQCEAARE